MLRVNLTYSARKPYLKLKESIVDLFKARIRYLKMSNVKESQFEKPYRDSEYPEMHLDIPEPDWPTPSPNPDWPKPTTPRPSGDYPGGITPGTPECAGCSLVGYPTHSSHCDDWWIDFHTNMVCTYYPPLSSIPREEWYKDCSISVYAFKGSIIAEAPGMFGDRISKYIKVDPAITEHELYGVFTDGDGNTCTAKVVQQCNCCVNLPNGAFEYDEESNPEAVDAGGSVDVYVQGGCTPYHWTVSGAGATWSNGSSSKTSYNVAETLSVAAGD